MIAYDGFEYFYILMPYESSVLSTALYIGPSQSIFHFLLLTVCLDENTMTKRPLN